MASVAELDERSRLNMEDLSSSCGVSAFARRLFDCEFTELLLKKGR